MENQARLLYSSANGDRWHLARDPESGRAYVRHTPNTASGGSVSHLRIGEFLARGNGPEQEALLEMIASLVTGDAVSSNPDADAVVIGAYDQSTVEPG